MKAVGAAAKAVQWQRDASGAIIVGGEKMEAGEYHLHLKPLVTRGAASLSTNDGLVVLDLTITPELEAEGRARDLVRMIQQARKDAGLNVADRVTIGLDMPSAFGAALATHRDYIAQQTLADRIGEGSSGAAHVLHQELDGVQFTIGLSRVA
jgi:isoleucyl-tRNA synthetase